MPTPTHRDLTKIPHKLYHKYPPRLDFFDLKTVNLHSRFLADTLLHKEVSHILSLVALKLNNLAELRIVDNGTVAARVFLESLNKLLKTQGLGQSLDGCEGLSTIPLLDTDMDVALLLGTIVDDPELGKVIQLQGDQRKNVADFLVKEGICKKSTVKVHGF
jgi:translation initiation factor SUI1